MNKLKQQLVQKIQGPYSRKRKLGNTFVYEETWHPANLPQLIAKLKPQAILVFTSGTDNLASKIIEANLPTAFFMFGSQISPQLCLTETMQNCKFVCESTFIAKKVELMLKAQSSIIKPIMERDKYYSPVMGKKILMVNPNPKKGGATVLEVAKKMPNRAFLIVGGWQHQIVDEEIEQIENGLATLTNVERLPNVEDMRPIFAESYCLLMPGFAEEAYGRTAAEAQICGLPVVASTQGALPETVGNGGITIDYQSPVDTWVKVINSLYENSALYAELSSNARLNSQASEKQTDFIEKQLMTLFTNLISQADGE